jgi:hypothetical protein
LELDVATGVAVVYLTTLAVGLAGVPTLGARALSALEDFGLRPIMPDALAGERESLIVRVGGAASESSIVFGDTPRVGLAVYRLKHMTELGKSIRLWFAVRSCKEVGGGSEIGDLLVQRPSGSENSLGKFECLPGEAVRLL